MRVAVVGTGHMGGWLALTLLQDKDGVERVAVFDLNRENTSYFNSMEKVEILTGLAQLKEFNPDLLINAVTIQKTVQVFKEAAPFLRDDCALCDVASVKGGITEFYAENSFPYVSLHPMFGPTFANVDDLKNENVIIIRESASQWKDFFTRFFQGLGVRTFEYSFSQHDQLIAYSLTLPFTSTMVFAACMNNDSVPGTTFKKHQEIAKGLLSEDDWLLSEILFSPFSLRQLEKVTSRLEFLKHIIKDRDYEEATRFFNGLRDNTGFRKKGE